MADPQQHAGDPVIRPEGEVLGPDEQVPHGRETDGVQGSAPSHRAIRFFAALVIAVFADLTQLLLLPLFGEGIVSPLNDALDVMVAFVMVTLLGFHWQFLPSFVSELVPVLNVAPAWTIAVLWVRRNERRTAEPDAS